MLQEIPIHLLKAAVEAARHAYSPYSGYSVGAAVETEDGAIYRAANMENASYGVTSCAEVGAVQAAAAAGKLSSIKRIAVVGGTPDGASRFAPVTPCGRCRQVIAEAANVSQRDVEVWCADLDLAAIESHTISELLPNAFQSAQTKDEKVAATV